MLVTIVLSDGVDAASHWIQWHGNIASASHRPCQQLPRYLSSFSRRFPLCFVDETQRRLNRFFFKSLKRNLTSIKKYIMSRYVQTFLPHERAILNNMFFQPSLCHFTRADEGEPVDALWTNSLCEDHSFAGPGQRLARIRCGDVMAFREIWIRGRAAYRNSNQPLRGRFAPSEWVKDVGGWWVGILRYRTFKLFLYSKTPRRALE